MELRCLNLSLLKFQDLNQEPKNKFSVIGTTLLNLAEYVSVAEGKDLEINVPLALLGKASEPPEPHPSLHVSISFLELRTSLESSETEQRSIVPIPLLPRSGEALSGERDELSALKAGLKKVKILTEYVSTRRSKKACWEEDGSDGKCSGRSDDAEYAYPFDSDSLDGFEEGDLEEGKGDSSFRKSFSYGTLASANHVGGSYYSEMMINGEAEDWVYYSNRKSDVGSVLVVEAASSIPDHSLLQTSKRSILSWRKRKLSFRSPKAKGEPLLKKAYAEEGGDDIDFDRRQLTSSDESLALGQPTGWYKTDDDVTGNRSSVSEFGDDNFAVGSWEQKELVSRDGLLKLSTQVFFASIDQRSERAAGESACTALVAVIADWFHSNTAEMPIKSQFDSLIREGSQAWRNLCETETYRERFPDKHFDLDTVLQAKIRPLSAVPEKSFIGFFHPEGMDDDGFDFLHGAMSFDSMWDEISSLGSSSRADSGPQIYIVSWNDHFFILKVDAEAYYILDTLGERLYEGCNQAFILKFDKDTLIHRLPSETKPEEKGKPIGSDPQAPVDVPFSGLSQPSTKETTATPIMEKKLEGAGNGGEEEEVLLCKGKESCKEYIKSFLAAIPLRELQVDIKKGLMASTPLHHRLQIEFHLTVLSQPELQLAEMPQSTLMAVSSTEDEASVVTMD
ncbi:hypothetical protein ACLOJK_040861 [Asimina triloba]